MRPRSALQQLTEREAEEEERAWEESLPRLADVLRHDALKGFHLHLERRGELSLEYRLPASSSWADTVLLGRGHDGPVAIVVELENWVLDGDSPGPRGRRPDRVRAGGGAGGTWGAKTARTGLLRCVARSGHGDLCGHRGQRERNRHRDLIQEFEARKLSEPRWIMKSLYDGETDTMVIVLREERIQESDEVRPGVIADFGRDGGIVRFEISEASRHVQDPLSVMLAAA